MLSESSIKLVGGMLVSVMIVFYLCMHHAFWAGSSNGGTRAAATGLSAASISSAFVHPPAATGVGGNVVSQELDHSFSKKIRSFVIYICIFKVE